MPDMGVVTESEVREPQPIAEIDVLWITAGLGCDGDTIAITAATQPSIEDLVLGAIPGIPKVNFRNPVHRPLGPDFSQRGNSAR
jgi:hydrogenase small subunit